MEYEIEDDEALFDESTNPSLEHGTRREKEKEKEKRPASRPNSAADKRKEQKAVHIPEEEQETQMA